MGNRRFHREESNRERRKLFLLSVEGSKTEKSYFHYLNSNSIIKCINKGDKSAPGYVLKSMEKYLKKNSIEKTDEAWLIVDKDNWDDKEFSSLYQWSQKEENYGLALSNPNFEFWLLLHFENGNGVCATKECEKKLKKYFPDYNKKINKDTFLPQQVLEAIERAKKRDKPPCKDWPRKTGTTVYRLIEKLEIIQNEK